MDTSTGILGGGELWCGGTVPPLLVAVPPSRFLRPSTGSCAASKRSGPGQGCVLRSAPQVVVGGGGGDGVLLVVGTSRPGLAR